MTSKAKEGELLDFGDHNNGTQDKQTEDKVSLETREEASRDSFEGFQRDESTSTEPVFVGKDPLESLPKDKLKLVEILRKVVDTWKLDEPEKLETKSDVTLYRYLHGYGYDMKQVPGFLQKMLSWRSKFKPQNIRLKDLKWPSKMFVFQKGFDVENHPVVYMILKNDNIQNTEENKREKFKHLVYFYEKAIRQMKPPVFQITVVADLKGSSLTLDLVKSVKGIFEELGEYYAERLCKIIILNAPWTIGACWTFIKPMMPAHVIAKYVFIKPKNMQEELQKYIKSDQLALYGKEDYSYDQKAWEEEEKALFKDK